MKKFKDLGAEDKIYFLCFIKGNWVFEINSIFDVIYFKGVRNLLIKNTIHSPIFISLSKEQLMQEVCYIRNVYASVSIESLKKYLSTLEIDVTDKLDPIYTYEAVQKGEGT